MSAVPRSTAWLVAALAALAQFGNFYVYDSIGPVADLLQQQRGFSDSQIGLLNAIYNLPNVVLILVGGVLVGVSPFDPLTLGAVAVGLALVAAVACYIPARRVAGIEPARSLFES